MINIFVVNLTSSPERKEKISTQLNTQGLKFEIFAAVDGRAGHHELFEKYNDSLSQRYRGKSLTKGQLGCYASHYLLWEKCVELNEPIIVLEDDAILDKALFSSFCMSCAQLPSNLEFIRLHANQRRKYSSYEVHSIEKLSIHRFSKGQMGTIGYFITPSAAKKLIEHSSEWIFPVDIMMDRFWETKVECFGVIPEIVTHNDEDLSDIGYNSKKPPKSFLTRCKREWFNFNEMLKRETHNALFRIKNK